VSQTPSAPPSWTLLSNHGHVLVCIAADPSVRLRDVAQTVGITERAVQKIVGDLEAGGLVSRTRTGRRNRYRIDVAQPLRQRGATDCTVGALLAALSAGA
jgi:DNA-binding MarR family transcriptional regulator